MNNSTYSNNPHFIRQNDVRIADISHHGPVGAVWAPPPMKAENSLLVLWGKYIIITLSFIQGVPVARLHHADRRAVTSSSHLSCRRWHKSIH